MSFFKRLFGNKTVERLSALDDRRLCDLGLTRIDLYQARHARRVGKFLHQRAAERATTWVR